MRMNEARVTHNGGSYMGMEVPTQKIKVTRLIVRSTERCSKENTCREKCWKVVENFRVPSMAQKRI